MRSGGLTLQAEEIRIGWCPVERVPELQAFIDQHWRRGHILARDRELLRWQYRHPEDPGRLSVLLAEDEEGLVGMLGLIPASFCLRGQRLRGAWLATWLVIPERRAGRAGLRLLQQAFEGDYSLVGVLGMAETTRSICRALRFQLWDTIPRWVRVVSPAALESVLTAPGAPDSSDAAWQSWLSTARKPAAGTNAAVRLCNWSEETLEEWDRAWQEQFAPQLLGTWRDAAYLRWRYVEHPRFRYELRFARDRSSDRMSGLLVYRVEEVRDRRERILRIVEFLGTEAAGEALAAAVVEAGQELEVAFADLFCTSSAFTPALEGAGFTREERMPVPLPSRFQPLEFGHTPLNGALWLKSEIAGAGSPLLNSPALYVTRSDGDQDRPN